MVDTLRRPQAYAGPGVDALSAPELRDLKELCQVVHPVDRPVKVVTGWLDRDVTLERLGEAGAKRVSVGGALFRRTLATFINVARTMQQRASFGWMRNMTGIADLRGSFKI